MPDRDALLEPILGLGTPPGIRLKIKMVRSMGIFAKAPWPRSMMSLKVRGRMRLTVDLKERMKRSLCHVNVFLAPKLPTADDAAARSIDHYPYRNWCRHCAGGRGRGGRHAAKTIEGDIPIGGFYCLFITKSGVESKNGLGERRVDADQLVEEGSALKCLVARDPASKALFGHPVPQKGVDAEGCSVVRAVGGMKWLGCTNLVLKAGNGPSILKLAPRALEMLRVQIEIGGVSGGHLHKHDSQANAAIEVAVRELRGHYGATRSDLECEAVCGLNPAHLLSMRVV